MLTADPAEQPSETPTKEPAPSRWLRRITLALYAAGCLLWLYNLSLWPASDFGYAVAGFAVLALSGFLWLVFAAISLIKRYPPRRALIAPAIVVVTFVLVALSVRCKLGWSLSKRSFEAAAAELRQHPEKAKQFSRRLGFYPVAGAFVDQTTGAVYFILETGGFLDQNVIAHATGEPAADTGPIHGCAPFDGPWSQCRELFG